MSGTPTTARARRSRVRMTRNERREQLIDVARALFAERGLEGTSVEEIAAHAGVSKPVVYEHFGGKEGLYAVVVDREVRTLHDSIRAAITTPDTNPRALIELGTLALLDYIDDHPNGFRILSRDSSATSPEGSFATILSDIASRVEGLPGAWLEGPGGRGLYSAVGSLSGAETILPEKLLVPGRHQRKNLLGAALALRVFGLPAEGVAKAMATFPGVEHRLELFAESGGVSWYNDSAATIPQAVEAALGSLEAPVVLITGGTDKNLDFEPVRAAFRKPKAVILLSGSGTEKLRPLLEADGVAYEGPYDGLDKAVAAAAARAKRGDAVLLSPGCTSFGMFLHEFDRGRKFKETVRALLEGAGKA